MRTTYTHVMIAISAPNIWISEISINLFKCTLKCVCNKQPPCSTPLPIPFCIKIVTTLLIPSASFCGI